jgi:hypothetical protein
MAPVAGGGAHAAGVDPGAGGGGRGGASPPGGRAGADGEIFRVLKVQGVADGAHPLSEAIQWDFLVEQLL